MVLAFLPLLAAGYCADSPPAPVIVAPQQCEGDPSEPYALTFTIPNTIQVGDTFDIKLSYELIGPYSGYEEAEYRVEGEWLWSHSDLQYVSGDTAWVDTTTVCSQIDRSVRFVAWEAGETGVFVNLLGRDLIDSLPVEENGVIEFTVQP